MTRFPAGREGGIVQRCHTNLLLIGEYPLFPFPDPIPVTCPKREVRRGSISQIVGHSSSVEAELALPVALCNGSLLRLAPVKIPLPFRLRWVPYKATEVVVVDASEVLLDLGRSMGRLHSSSD